MADNETPQEPVVPAVETPVPTVAPAKAPTCPACKGTLIVYVGNSANKVGTGFCDTCGTRQALKG